MVKPQKKLSLTKAQIKNIQWLNAPKGKDAIRVGRFEEYWILSQKAPNSSLLIYDQTEWDTFVEGVKQHAFDNLIKRG